MRPLVLAFFAALALTPCLAFAQTQPTPRELARVDRILWTTPLIDGHNDLPWEIRDSHGGDLDAVDLNGDTRALTPLMHTDIPRLRLGRVGGQFWSVYVPAALRGADATRAVYEQIDLTQRGGEALNNSLATSREFREAGVLYMTLRARREAERVAARS